MMDSKETMARGRFAWGQFVVTYRHGETRYEDRSDGSWWNHLPKDDITSVSIEVQYADIYPLRGIKHTLKASKSHNYRFFLYRGKKVVMGRPSMCKEWMGMGMVTNKEGDCQVIEVRPNGSVFAFTSNVIEVGRNLALHEIILEEIY